MIKAISSRAIKNKDNPNNLPNITKELSRRQGGKCPITGRYLSSFSSSNVVCDHDHKTGVIRAALPRGVNGLEGKLVKACLTWGSCKDTNEVISMLRGVSDYLDLHRTAQTEWIYPDHMTPSEKRIENNRKARAKYSKKKE